MSSELGGSAKIAHTAFSPAPTLTAAAVQASKVLPVDGALIELVIAMRIPTPLTHTEAHSPNHTLTAVTDLLAEEVDG